MAYTPYIWYINHSKQGGNLENSATKIMKGYSVEVEKGSNWPDGYLNWKGEIVPAADMEVYEDFEAAEMEAALFNGEYGNNGRIYARVRVYDNRQS